MMISFYDLDCMIDLNEKRQAEYLEAYHKTQDKFTHLMILYSVEAIFLIPVIQSLFFSTANCNWLFHLSFYLYIILYVISICYSIRLLTPSVMRLPVAPEIFYSEYRKHYERMGFNQPEIDARLKTTYLDELEYSVGENLQLLRKKMHFFLCAYLFSVFALGPYIACVTFQLNQKDETIHKVEIVKTPEQ